MHELFDYCGNYPRLLDEILTGLHQAVILADLNGQVVFANQYVADTMGFHPEELIGGALSKLFTPEDMGFFYPNLLYLARNNQIFEGEAMLQRKNGQKFFVYLVLRPCLGENLSPPLIIFCIQDIDRQKQFETAVRETHFEDLVKIANGIAHEIRNPLVGIGGFAGRLYKECHAQMDQAIYYDYIVSNLKKIESLIKKVDYLVSLPKPDYRPVSLRDLVEVAARPYLEAMAGRGIELTCSINGLEVLVDPDLVERILTVFIENSMDAMKGGGTILVDGAIDNQQCLMTYADNGPGISEDDLPYIFNPFFSTKADGAGIDLAVVKRIMECHGGKVEAESSPGNGVKFRLTFPLERRRAIRTASLAHDQAISQTIK